MDSPYERPAGPVKGEPSEAPRVSVLSTGGTIATVTGPDGKTRPALSVEEIGPAPNVETERLFQEPSWTLGPGDMVVIARRSAELAAGRGVVVTHGTTTMEHTAFLADLLWTGPFPVVFTGAMRRADDPDPDGPRNLADAVAVAGADGARDSGALICFGGELFAAAEASKQHRSSITPFVAPDGPVGVVTPDGVRFDRRPRRRRCFDAVETAVALVKAYPGAGPAVLDAAVAEGAKGIVIEGLPGFGAVPPKMFEALRRARDAGVVVVLTSSARYGEIPRDGHGGTGEPLRDVSVVTARSLTAEKSWVLLMCALGASSDVDEIQTIYDAFDR